MQISLGEEPEMGWKETEIFGLMKGKDKVCCIENCERYESTERRTDLEGEIKD